MTFSIAQRDRIRAALEARAAHAPKIESRKLRRVASESRLFDRFVSKQYARIKKANPNAADGEIFDKLIEFITSGKLEQLIKAVIAILAMFT